MQFRRALALALALAIVAGPSAVPVFAQDAAATTPPPAPAPAAAAARPSSPVLQDYTRPRSHFPTIIGPYIGRTVPEPSFANTPRIDQLMRNGTLYLSMNDAIALALENNLDLAIARYNLSIADTDILRTKAGSAARGVNTGLVQGTPGGGVGGLGTGASGAGAGGSTSGAGGAGTGVGGIVASTSGVGTTVDSFDPILSSNLSIEHQVFQTANTVTTGTPNVQQNFGTANFSYFQGWGTGTAMNVTFNNQRAASNSLFTALVPDVTSSFRMTLRQHLLAGFGTGPNRRFIRIAKNNREISDISFRQQVDTTVSQIANIYWDLVNAYEDVKVKERSLSLANKTLSDNKKQVEIGTLAPIEITRAESEVGTRQQDLIVSQTNLELQQLLMKNAISRNLTDPTLAAAPVIPTDTMAMAEQEPVVPVQDLIGDAMGHRPELAQARIDLVNRDITNKSARNALLPVVDLNAWYGASGLGGQQNVAATCLNVAADPSGCDAADAAAGRFLPAGSIQRTGFPQSFNKLFDNNFPDYGVSLSIQIPIRNRSAQADQVRSELEYRQAQMRLQQLQNQVTIEVRNAQYALQQNRARVEAAQKARDLAQESLNAEQKKYALGASTNTLVLQAQRDLTQAESNVVSAMSAYEKSRVELDRVTGLTLDHNNISLGDSETGVVNKMPAAPGVKPRAD
ncbi:MAG TPA: TolC family protein, partial [Terriglobales bacterium]|nr:TolC family protein [Terriglobales bacterium]